MKPSYANGFSRFEMDQLDAPRNHGLTDHHDHARNSQDRYILTKSGAAALTGDERKFNDLSLGLGFLAAASTVVVCVFAYVSRIG